MTDELKLPLIEREIKCLADFRADMTRKFDNRDPARTTYEFINKTNLEMQKQTDNLASLTKTLDTHVQDQKIQDAEIKRNLEDFHKIILDKMDTFIDSNDVRIGRLENWKSWVIGLFSVIGIVMALITYIYVNDIGSIKTELKEHINQTIK